MKKKIITPDDGYEYFFGYYDLQPYDSDMKRHLAARSRFADRIPKIGDELEVGYIDLDSGAFVRIATTSAWNFQQGALLQWFDNDSVIFNDFDGEKYISRVVSVDGRELRQYDRAFATVSLKSKKAISLNFARIYDFRPGYGYCNVKDPLFDVLAPESDGIFLTDLESSETKLLMSYAEMKTVFEEKPFTDEKLVVNHINFDPSGEKCVFLLRNFPKSGKRWGTVLAAIDLNGKVTPLTRFEVNSHYSWKDSRNLMIYSGLPRWGIYFFDTETGERTELNDPLCDYDDIHCNYSPDRSCFIGDGYPDKKDNRTLFYYDFGKKRSKALFSVYSLPDGGCTDIRCDLHARWSPDGSRISYDTTENVRREIAEIVLENGDLDFE